MSRIALAVMAAAALVARVQATPIPEIALIPSSGDVSGAPGAVVGWGFDLTYNAPSDWVVLTGSEFTGSTIDGSYMDYLSLPTAPLYVAGPSPESSTALQDFNFSSKLGLGDFDINSTAPAGATVSGDIVVHYSVFSVDPNNPNFDPGVDTVITDATLSNAVQISVTPEPSYFSLLLAGLAVFALAGARQRVSATAPK